MSKSQWLKDSLHESDTIFVIIIFSWNYTYGMESQKYILFGSYFWNPIKILGARSRMKTKNSSPLLYKTRKYQHSCKITDHKGENVIALDDLVRISAN